MDDIQEDLDQAAEHAQQVHEQGRREAELLARAPTAHAELRRIKHETEETCKALNWAIDKIFHG